MHREIFVFFRASRHYHPSRAQMDAGQMLLECIQISLMELLKKSLSLIQSSADQKGVSLSLVCTDDIPAILFGDPLRLQQVSNPSPYCFYLT